MRPAAQVPVLLPGPCQGGLPRGRPQDHLPGAAQPTKGSGEAVGVPGSGHLEIADEHLVGAQGVGAPVLHHFVRCDDVSPALGHLFSVLPQDHSLIAQALEGLGKGQVPQITERLGPKAGVEQVHDRVLGPSHVHVHRKPVVHFPAIKGHLVIARTHEAQEIPGGAGEGSHGVGLTAPADAAGQGHLDELGNGRQGRLAAAGGLVVPDLRQAYRKIAGGHGNLAVRGVNDGDGSAPIPLAADPPVAQLVMDAGSAPIGLLQPVGNPVDGLGGGSAVEGAGPAHDSLARPGLLHGVGPQRFVPARGLDHHPDLQAVPAGELEVSLVVGRDRHDGAGSIPHQHIVRHPDGDGFTVDRIGGMGSQEHASLGPPLGRPIQIALALDLLQIGLDLFSR